MTATFRPNGRLSRDTSPRGLPVRIRRAPAATKILLALLAFNLLAAALLVLKLQAPHLG